MRGSTFVIPLELRSFVSTVFPHVVSFHSVTSPKTPSLLPPTGKGDLEDKILKKNIPGKFTWWEKDSDEEGEGARADWLDGEASDPEAELSELQKQQKWVETDCPEPIRRTIMAREEKERARTGVKGVLADYGDWKRSKSAEALLAREYRAAMLKRMTEGHIVPGSAPPPSEESPGGGGDDDEEEGDEENAGDEEFLGSYRRRRLEQLKASAGRPHFGQIRETDRTSFVSEVDTEDPRTFVVVHLYEPYIGACGRMNRFLEVLATKQPTVKFLRLRTSAADESYDPIALPTLLLYRAGEVIGCMTRVTEDIGESFTLDDVEWLLQEHDVFEAPQKPGASLTEHTGTNGALQHQHQPAHQLATGRGRKGEALDSDDEGDSC